MAEASPSDRGPATASGTKILVGGSWETSEDVLVVNEAGGGPEYRRTYRASLEQYERAVEAAVTAFEHTRVTPSYQRGNLLRSIAEGIEAAREDLAHSLALEAGKPIGDARIEVDRTALAFRISAEEAERMGGEVIPLDLTESARGRWGITRRMPLGPVAAITPFNVPLSLAAHKLGPALAAGNTIVLKPPSQVPNTLLHLAEIIDRAGAIPGSVSVMPMARDLGDRLVEDPRFRLLTFTGSSEVGWDMRARAGTKKVALELGGNAGLIVDETADPRAAVPATLRGAFKHAGQLCISVQRAFVHETIWDAFLEGLVEGASKLTVGHPLDESVDLGPMISVAAADKFLSAVSEAESLGAKVLEGGERDGAYVRPTVLVDVPPESALSAEEAFAPVIVVSPFSDFDAALAAVNDSEYGLQAGLFTTNLQRAWHAFEVLDVGGVIVNDVPTFRMDNMPYGGNKSSGEGREGIKFAMEHMTELRLMVMSPDRRNP
ncbi:MAG TPA: aldehyde dehydrogenase family protein [Acidimicrobiia bacterium]|nr:aldehyde dehydrogenase family protein [Acidimicrobiia bacterium]